MPLRTALFSLLLASLAAPAFANTAEDYFRDGNRLFNDDLYWAALLRYREAREAGLDTPLLSYNTGVAHYKAGQHQRAREEFKDAARSSSLRHIAHYNLGLNAAKLGETEEALRWFRLSRDQAEDPRLARLSREAIRRLRTKEAEEDVIEQRAERRRETRERRFSALDVRLEAGFGSNDNVYRTPAEPYVDFAQAGDPLVTPTVVSGAYVPVDLSLRYNIKNAVFENFFTRYRLSADIYQDKELDNANEFVHELSFGSRYSRERNGVHRRVFSAFRIAQHDETYFDPDDGLTRDVGGVDIGDRLNHRRYGPLIRFRQDGEVLGFGAFFEGQLRNYDDVEAVPEYDHEYLNFGFHTQFRFTETSLLRLELEGESRTFGDRPSYDLDGRQRLGNPSVEYQYLTGSVTARQKITRHAWFGVSFARTERTDEYIGYYDYTRDSFHAEIQWAPTRRLKLEASARYSIYDYPNAFAFNDDNLSRRTLETLHGRFEGTWRITDSLRLIGDVRVRESSSNDARIEYDQTAFSLSLRWSR